MERLGDERVVRDLAGTGEILGAGELVREDDGEQVLGILTLELRRSPAAAVAAFDGERDGCRPAPSRGEQRCVQQRLCERVAGTGAGEVSGDLVEGKAVSGAQGEDDAVLECGGLQLEIEAPAEALAQRQSPGAVDPRPVGRVDDEVHVTGLVEEPLHGQLLLTGDHAQRRACQGEVAGELFRRCRGQSIMAH